MADEFKTRSQKNSEAKLDTFLDSIEIKSPEEQQTPEVPQEQPSATFIENPPQPPVEQTPEVPQEQPPVETPPGEPIPTPQEDVFELEKFNKRFSTEFGDEDSVKDFLSKKAELERLADLDNKYKDIEAKYNEAKQLLDPRQHFISEEEYKRQLILKKYGEEINPNLLNKIVSQDANKMSDLDVLILGKQVGNPNFIGGDGGVRQLIYDQFGIDSEEMGSDPDKWSDLVKNRLSDAAAPVRKSLNQIKSVEVPQVQDFEVQRQATIQAAEQLKTQLKDGWTKVVTKLVKDFSEYEYLEGKKFKVDEDFKKMGTDVLLDHLIDNDIELNEENVKKAQLYLKNEFWQQRGIDILKSHASDIETQYKEQKMKTEDNPKPRNQKETPPAEVDKQKADLKAYMDEGKSTGKIKLG